MLFMPFPGRADNLFELRVFRLPTEFVARFVRRGHELWWVARAARLFDNRNLPLANSFTSRDHLANGVTVAVPQVVEALFPRRHCKDVGLRQVDYVNVVADARAVRCRIIGPKN